MKQAKAKKSLSGQLKNLLLTMMIPVCILVVVLIIFVVSNVQYQAVSRNIATASQFNQNFRDDVDHKMYYLVIGSEYATGLPIEEVETAQALARDLLAHTEDKDSTKAIHSVLNLCENLESCIYEVEQTEGYDARVQLLETNIYVLTALIEEYMYTYLYHEAGYLAEMQERLNVQLILLTAVILVAAVLLVCIALQRAINISRGITRPIDALSQRVEAIGQGDLTVREPVQAEDGKLQTLSDGFEEMVARLNRLLELNKQEQAKLRSMELALLQAQINPHFLYNTLDTIIWLIETGKNDEAVEMVSNLSTYFRSSLSKGRDVITLKEEEQHVRSYLEIQQVRYKDILTFEIDMDPAMAGCRLPKLTLQPLVENALYHGIKLKRGMGTIQVTSRGDGDSVVLKIRDTGAGMTPARLEQVQSSLLAETPAGFGMATVYKRLRLMFGEQCSFQVTSQEGVGTTVTVRLPQKGRETE